MSERVGEFVDIFSLLLIIDNFNVPLEYILDMLFEEYVDILCSYITVGGYLEYFVLVYLPYLCIQASGDGRFNVIFWDGLVVLGLMFLLGL